MCEQVRHLQVPIPRNGRNMTVGDLIDMSPKDSISKVVLEEKVFDTWFGGRTVLLGDGRCLLFTTLFFGIFFLPPLIHLLYRLM